MQAHYDLSDDFFRLFLDPTQTYSCAYFERDDMTLEEAQIAKIDLALGKLGLEPGMTLLDVGCGWGATMMRAVEKYDVNVVGLTLSRNQASHVEQLIAKSESPRAKRVLLQGWEQFDEPVDRIVSIGAFEHFGHERYDAFFAWRTACCPPTGSCCCTPSPGCTRRRCVERGMPMSFTFARFLKFMVTEIFPGGRLPSIPMVHERATANGFTVTRVQSLQPHYAKTLDIWSAALQAHKDAGHRAAIRGSVRAIHEVPDRLRRDVPHRLHRRQSIHLREVHYQCTPGTNRTSRLTGLGTPCG